MPKHQSESIAYAWDAILRNVALSLTQAAGENIEVEELVTPPTPDVGDLSFPCFNLAKKRAIPPATLAEQIAAAVRTDDGSIEKISFVGPYVNITLRASELAERILGDVEAMKGEYGCFPTDPKDMIVFEYANPNTHKEIHIGHLRNFVLGVALTRIQAAAGRNVIPVSYINDVGSNVGRCLWWLVTQHGFSTQRFSESDLKALLEKIPADQRTAKYLGDVYAESTVELEKNPDTKTDISFVQTQLEQHVSAWEQLWVETRHWCLTEFKDIFEELGIQIDRQYLESDGLDRSHEIVRELLAKGIAKESEGAIIVDLEHEKLGVFLLRKSDGTLLYSSKDLALAEHKVRDYPAMRQSLVLIDQRQSLYFKQLKRTLELKGVTVPFDIIPYGLVTLKEGTMSSRKGNIVTYQSFKDAVIEYAKKEVAARHTDWPEGKIAYTAWSLAMAGMKFGMLKQDNDRTIVFDFQAALSFDGSTGPYVQYAATRLASILRKGEWDAARDLTRGDVRMLIDPRERQLILHLGRFPHVVRRASQDARPSLIAQWCLDTATRVNEWYRDVRVLEAEGGLREARLRLAASARTVLLLGLNLLAIPAPEEM